MHAPCAGRLAVIAIYSVMSPELPVDVNLWAASCRRVKAFADCWLLLVHSTHKATMRGREAIQCGAESALRGVRVLHTNGTGFDALAARVGLSVTSSSWEAPNQMGAFKPLTADLLEHLQPGSLEPYSHWAWSDIDLILGRKLHYYLCATTPVAFYHTDGWSPPTASGQLTMFPNTQATRQLWRSSPLRWQLEHKHYWNFDELAFGQHLQRSFPVIPAADVASDRPLGVRNARVFKTSPSLQLRSVRVAADGRICLGMPCTIDKNEMHRARPDTPECAEEWAAASIRFSMRYAKMRMPDLCEAIRRYAAPSEMTQGKRANAGPLAGQLDWWVGCVAPTSVLLNSKDPGVRFLTHNDARP